MKNLLLGALLGLVVMAAQAGTTKDIESSAVVRGTIVLTKNGTVQTVVVDDEAKYGKPIADLVRNAALQWRFYPVLRNGVPVLAKASMRVRVVLRKQADGNYNVRIKGATFGDMNKRSSDALSNAKSNRSMMPRYPHAAIRARVQGTVYLALRVDRSGHVTDAVVEQVNLDNTGPNSFLKQYRNILAKAALEPAKRWTYEIPTTGPLATQNSWTARVPVAFTLSVMGALRQARIWETYVPGPFTPAPWSNKPNMDGVDAIASGDSDDVQTEGAGPVRLSPPHQG